MPKISQCDRCLFYAHDYHIICVPHPGGPDDDICLDFKLDPEYSCQRFEDFIGLQQRRGSDDEPFHNPCGTDHDEQLWEPAGASYYAGELIVQPRQLWTREEQFQLLDTHPMFTGCCLSVGLSLSETTGPWCIGTALVDGWMTQFEIGNRGGILPLHSSMGAAQPVLKNTF